MSHTFDVDSVRCNFPVTSTMLYLDSAHQAPLATNVRMALNRFYDEGEKMGGPKHVWLERVERTRLQVARLLGASYSEVAFTKNTSEGLNIAANSIPLNPGDNVLLIEGDHPNNACAWLNLRRKGVEIRFVRLTTEIADASTFESYVDSRTRVITLSHVTFHAGQRHDVASVGRLCKRAGIHLVVDAMQSVGVMPVDVKAMGVSILAAGCHKGLLVPQGLGILYVKEGLDEIRPTYLAMAGLKNPPSDYIARPSDMALRADARRFELGNLNLPDIHALSASIDFILGIGVERIAEHVLELGDRLIRHADDLGIRLVGPRDWACRSHIYVLGLDADDWFDYLSKHSVRVSPERDGIRVSFAMFNSLDDVDRFAEVVRSRSRPV